MTAEMPLDLQMIARRRAITADDALTIRRAVFGQTQVTDAEADWLFTLNADLAFADPAWDQLFVETLTDYCVHQVEPRGYVSEAKARWLIDRVTHDGEIEAARELELLVSVLQKSTSSPASLATFVLKTVRDCVLAGAGPLRGRTPDFRPKVCAHDVDIMRRAIFAFGAGGNIAVTREEAEFLCDINDATAHAANDPAWPDLFAKAIGNHLTMAATFTPATQDVASAREKWLNDQSVNVGGFFGKIASGIKGAWGGTDSHGKDGGDAWTEREKLRNAAIDEAAPVTAGEAAWLGARFERDGHLSPAEEALVRFLKADGAPVHSSLQSLMARAA